MIGILPTLMPDHVTLDSVSENPRYSLLDQQIFAARGEDLEIIIDGTERLQMVSDIDGRKQFHHQCHRCAGLFVVFARPTAPVLG